MRIILAALALSALSFVAGVAGDLSTPPANAGQAVTLRLPPPIPADAPRAGPLISTQTAMAAQPRQQTAHATRIQAKEALAPVESAHRETKPLAEHMMLATLPKLDEHALAKAKARKQG